MWDVRKVKCMSVMIFRFMITNRFRPIRAPVPVDRSCGVLFSYKAVEVAVVGGHPNPLYDLFIVQRSSVVSSERAFTSPRNEF